MSKHLESAIKELKKDLLALSALVEEHLHRAVTAIHDRDESLAHTVIDTDFKIDQAEVDVEEECLKIMALHQPVAIDLRFIVAALKINNDLERIGDLAVNLAERALFLSRIPLPEHISLDLPGMAKKAEHMLRKSMDALVNMDAELAWHVCGADDEVDDINRKMYDQVKAAIRKHPEHIDALIHILSASRHVERIADHATNIAEDVIYMIEGEIVRHRADERQ